MLKKFSYLFFVFLGIVMLGSIGLGLFVYKVSQDLPSVAILREYHPSVPSVILDRHDKVLMELGTENRELVPFDKIPKIVISAVLSAEDDSFFEHSGVDVAGLFRAMLNNIRAGKVVQGGSTITQQVAKSLLLTNEKTIQRKIKDFLLAIEIEKSFSKEEILYLYLNQVYLGSGYYGIKAAIQGYFGKDISKISIAEAALLAGLLSAPGRYSPLLNPAYAKVRQKYVLHQMYEKGRISQQEYDQALNETVKLILKKSSEIKAPYYAEWIRQMMVALVGEKAFLSEGYKIKTTIDLDVQNVLEKSALDGVKKIDKRQGYKGVDNHVPPDQLIQNESDLYQEIAGEHSEYKQLLPDGTILDQNGLKPDEVKKFQSDLFSYYSASEMLSKQFGMPILASPYNDPQKLKFLESGKTYKAIVIKTNDRLKLVFCSLGGIWGVIPESGFKWAHKRKIDENSSMAYVEIDRPSSILKPGDRITVSLRSTQPANLSQLADKSGLTSLDVNNKDVLKQTAFLVLDLEQKPEIQTSIISMDPNNGEILGLVGGNNYFESKFNRAIQSLRQAGSAIKPLIYAASLEEGFTPATILMDTPQSLSGIDNLSAWKPKNYDNEFKGLITLRTSLQESRNVSTINLMQRLGLDAVVNFIKRLQINAKVPRDMSIALGSFGISLLDLVKAYAIFPNGGNLITEKKVLEIYDRNGLRQRKLEDKINSPAADPSKIEVVGSNSDLASQNSSDHPSDVNDVSANDSDAINDSSNANNSKEGASGLQNSASTESGISGEVANNASESNNSTAPNVAQKNSDKNNEKDNDENKLKKIDFKQNLSGDKVYDERLAYIMSSLLAGVIQAGTAQDAKRLPGFYGGKTGTTSNYVDAWFIGFSKKLITGVWTGFDNNTTLGYGETGATAALPIWINIMDSLANKYIPENLKVPVGLAAYNVDQKTGRVVKGITSQSVRDYFVPGTQPGGIYDSGIPENADGSSAIVDDGDFWSKQ